jgi:hypothetical protein
MNPEHIQILNQGVAAGTHGEKSIGFRLTLPTLTSPGLSFRELISGVLTLKTPTYLMLISPKQIFPRQLFLKRTFLVLIFKGLTFVGLA